MTDREREAVERLRAACGLDWTTQADVDAVLAALDAAEQLNERLVKRTGDCTIQIDHLLRRVAAMEPVVAAAEHLWDMTVVVGDSQDAGWSDASVASGALMKFGFVMDAYRATQSARYTDTEGAK